MRRAVPVLAATAGVLALLANFHTRPIASGLVTSAAPGAGAGTGTGHSPNDPGPNRSPSPAGASSTTGGAGSVGGPTSRSSTSTGSASRPSASPAPAATAPATRSIDGPVVPTSFGPVQVRVTVHGSQIVDVQALELPVDRARSQRISAQAGPELRTEALKAQSAKIDVVSGATYTSGGYSRSLQGALDAARP